MIKAENVRHKGRSAKASEPVYPGERIEVDPPPPAVPVDLEAQEIPLQILYEDSDLLVINKPAGLIVHPGAGNPDGTLVNAVLHHCPDLVGIGGEERPGVVHRLDKETSGCLVLAKNDTAHRSLSTQFADRTVRKEYLAVVEGRPKTASGRVDAAIGRHPIHRQKMTVSKRPGAREAVTDYLVLITQNGLSLLLCKPTTGRTHQIRVHLKHLGYPLAGDPVYGKRGAFARHLLHAWHLAFQHPASGEWLEFEAPVPDDFPLVPPPKTGQNRAHV
jgi:23S rRNA pseudouridine1911/1915/1917 synthase